MKIQYEESVAIKVIFDNIIYVGVYTNYLQPIFMPVTTDPWGVDGFDFLLLKKKITISFTLSQARW